MLQGLPGWVRTCGAAIFGLGLPALVAPWVLDLFAPVVRGFGLGFAPRVQGFWVFGWKALFVIPSWAPVSGVGGRSHAPTSQAGASDFPFSEKIEN